MDEDQCQTKFRHVNDQGRAVAGLYLGNPDVTALPVEFGSEVMGSFGALKHLFPDRCVFQTRKAPVPAHEPLFGPGGGRRLYGQKGGHD